MNAALRAILFVVLGLILALTFLLPLAMGQPLPGQSGGGREATKTPVSIDTPPPSPTASATPVARSFAPAVFEVARTPTRVITKTPPPDGPSPTPSATPIGRAFAPAVFEVARTATRVITKTPPPDGPSPTPSATPIGRAFAPAVFEVARTATLTPSPTSTLAVEPSKTMPAIPP